MNINFSKMQWIFFSLSLSLFCKPEVHFKLCFYFWTERSLWVGLCFCDLMTQLWITFIWDCMSKSCIAFNKNIILKIHCMDLHRLWTACISEAVSCRALLGNLQPLCLLLFWMFQRGSAPEFISTKIWLIIPADMGNWQLFPLLCF